MKIRQDFVTNSSSVSYIITFCPHLYQAMDRFHWKGRESEKGIKNSRIEKILIDDILETGTSVYWEGSNLYVKKYTFDTDEITSDYLFEEQGEEPDFKNISDEELWEYIKGQFFTLGDLGNVNGFGVTQIETY